MTTPVSREVAAVPADFIRLPGVFRRWEVAPIASDPKFWVAELSRDDEGTLYGVWTRTVESMEVDCAGRERQSGELPSTVDISMGEMKARRRKEHLCFRCNHYPVCGVASAIDEKLLMTITRCMGFFSVEAEDAPSGE